jgi:hypothetical protein
VVPGRRPGPSNPNQSHKADLSDWRTSETPDYASVVLQLRVDSAGLQTMASRWEALVGELGRTTAPAGLAVSSQASAVAVRAAHADITDFAAELATRVGARATHVAHADARYVSNEADSAEELGAVVGPATSL